MRGSIISKIKNNFLNRFLTNTKDADNPTENLKEMEKIPNNWSNRDFENDKRKENITLEHKGNIGIFSPNNQISKYYSNSNERLKCLNNIEKIRVSTSNPSFKSIKEVKKNFDPIQQFNVNKFKLKKNKKNFNMAEVNNKSLSGIIKNNENEQKIVIASSIKKYTNLMKSAKEGNKPKQFRNKTKTNASQLKTATNTNSKFNSEIVITSDMLKKTNNIKETKIIESPKMRVASHSKDSHFYNNINYVTKIKNVHNQGNDKKENSKFSSNLTSNRYSDAVHNSQTIKLTNLIKTIKVSVNVDVNEFKGNSLNRDLKFQYEENRIKRPVVQDRNKENFISQNNNYYKEANDNTTTTLYSNEKQVRLNDIKTDLYQMFKSTNFPTNINLLDRESQAKTKQSLLDLHNTNFTPLDIYNISFKANTEEAKNEFGNQLLTNETKQILRDQDSLKNESKDKAFIKNKYKILIKDYFT